MEITKITPPPAPEPPRTFIIELTLDELRFVAHAVALTGRLVFDGAVNEYGDTFYDRKAPPAFGGYDVRHGVRKALAHIS